MESSADIEAALKFLRDLGLRVEELAERIYHVSRPILVPGNKRKDWLHPVTDDEGNVIESLDAPTSMLFLDAPERSDTWVFRMWKMKPGPGPGDFERLYTSVGAAVQDVQSYYFGDPAWMCAEWNKYLEGTWIPPGK